jgi:hypothetical protein
MMPTPFLINCCGTCSSFFLCLLIYYVRCAHLLQANADTLEVVSTLIAEQLAIDVSQVQAESKFTDLGADSLDTVRVL